MEIENKKPNNNQEVISNQIQGMYKDFKNEVFGMFKDFQNQDFGTLTQMDQKWKTVLIRLKED